MPIPTPEPPVTRYNLKIAGEGPQDWCKWSEVEALLLQRAQEIAEVQDDRDAWREKAETVEAQLTARAQEIEQVKADTRQLVQELTAALNERPDRDRTHWVGCHTDPGHRDCAIARLLAALSRADQP